MRKQREPDSSLELLLDTMCNTFGCVMFIAISLVVIISSASLTQTISEFSTETEAERILKELDRLEKKLKMMESDVRLQQELEKKLTRDPRRELLRKRILFENQVKLLQTKLKLMDSEKVLLQLKKNKTAASLKKISRERDQLEDAHDKLFLELKDLEHRKERLRNSATLETIQLQTLEKHSRQQPYYILVEHGSAWRVGPILDPQTRNYMTHPDVSSKQINQSLHCRINPANGIPLLSGNDLSEAFKKMLSTLGKTRIPQFSVKADSAADFSKARERMKDAGILHGFDTEYDRRENEFIIYITNGGFSYEY